MQGFGPAFSYNPADWYWIVAESDTEVYCSKTGKLVPVSDADYEKWLTTNRFPSRIASLAELRDVFQQQSAFALSVFNANQVVPA